jgi:hypothetical protein
VRLQAAVARVLDQGKERQSFLKKSLGTKDLKTANIRAKPVQAGFDRVFGEAEQLLAARPMRGSLSAIEIKRMAEIYNGTTYAFNPGTVATRESAILAARRAASRM